DHSLDLFRGDILFALVLATSVQGWSDVDLLEQTDVILNGFGLLKDCSRIGLECRNGNLSVFTNVKGLTVFCDCEHFHLMLFETIIHRVDNSDSSAICQI